eukprot:GHVO01021836.1.p1 GENE.GHVO01021836.1~~GHVO01021836.1.p1  ORF type:complete len:133 (-),score=20.42 GHVO01021836.1:114-470(-)
MAEGMEAETKEDIIPETSKGYKLLRQAGWKDGEALGASGSGILEPVEAKAQKSFITPENVKSDEDEFESYRKRMMMAYRFRPNPLNNPRRSYDGYQTIYAHDAIPKVMGNVMANKKTE